MKDDGVPDRGSVRDMMANGGAPLPVTVRAKVPGLARVPAGNPGKQDRITIVETVYFQKFREQPVEVSTRHTRFLKTDEQLYVRRLLAKAEWAKVDCGWVPVASMLILSNTDSVPIEVTHGPGDDAEAEWEVYPGDSLRGTPRSLERLRVRAPAGPAKYTLNLIPA